MALDRSEIDAARDIYHQAQRLYRAAKSLIGEASCLRSLGDVALRSSDIVAAKELYEKAQSICRQFGSPLGEANCVQRLVEISIAGNDYEGAQARLEEAADFQRAHGSALGEASCLRRLGDIAHKRTNPEAALVAYRRAIPFFGREARSSVRRTASAVLVTSHSSASPRILHAIIGLKLLYSQRVPDALSLGWTHQRLAKISVGEERNSEVKAAQAAWASIGRSDLSAQMI